MNPDYAADVSVKAYERAANEPADNKSANGKRKNVGPSASLKLTFFDECSHSVTKPWILKGLIALGETSSWIAPPGAGKSALLTEIAVHAASGRDWRGHKAKESCGVVYIAMERADLQKRRFEVYGQRDGLRGLPIAVADAVVDLMKPDCVAKIIATIETAEKRFECAVGLIVIDPFAKGIAAGGGDEDKARDQNIVLANLRMVHSKHPLHIAIVGHTGKDENRGARGSNAHVGDVDVMVQISGDNIKTADVIMANDQPQRIIAQFKLECFEFGKDEDGDPISTAIVSPEHFAAASFDDARRKAKKVQGANKIALDLLRKALDEAGERPPASNHIPPDTRTISVETWRRYADHGTITESDKPDSKSKAFRRASNALQSAGLIGTWNDHVWIIPRPGQART